MGQWLDTARMAAARRAGRRYWKLLLAAHLIRIAAPGLLAITAAATVTVLVWRTAIGAFTMPHLPTMATDGGGWAALLRGLAFGAGLTWLGWLARDLVTGAALRRRQTGTRQPVPAYALGAALALLIASLIIR